MGDQGQNLEQAILCHQNSLQLYTDDDYPVDWGETTNNQPTIITFEVTDTGVGIAADELENLFQPFVQTASGQQVQQGTGLGLTISRQFVRLMGGEITLISRGKAFCPPASQTPSGTTFKFDIPVGIADESEIENQPHSDRSSTQNYRDRPSFIKAINTKARSL